GAGAGAGAGADAGPHLPRHAADLQLTTGRPTTVPSEEESADSAWRVLSYTGPDHMRAVVALPLDTVDGATTKLLWVSLGLGAAVAVGVVVLGNSAVRLGLRPLSRVESTAQHITDGALELNVPVTDPDTEVGRLARALNTMLDRLRTALHRTETSEQQLRHFLADAGHELRTPLTAVQGFAELLLDEPGMPQGRRHQAHALISHNADRMSRLVDDLFLLARLGGTGDDHSGPTGTRTAHREPVDLLSLAADAIATTAVRHPRRRIALEPLAGPSTASGAERDLDIIEVPGDPLQLAQVLGNLLSNACTHTPAGAAVHVRVGTTRTPAAPQSLSTGPPLAPGTRACVIEVADDGPGIHPDEAPHVFDRFYRATPSGRPEGDTAPGSGLGLAIASAVATAHGGRLELDNRPGAGCTFRLLLPDPSDLPQVDRGAARHRPSHL
ncbi:HAMP domain-containing protein, partial [Streptomyces sp. SID5785]|uniref:HAMP domain-containing sensor histidine kinase n=1 Tax=Streptomyces sp. SID5785 TaxID=2690309 RepID=UPI001361E3E9